MKAGDTVEVAGEDLAYGGDTVARLADGFVVFVPGLAPGDRARVRIDRVWANRARGRAVELLTPGPDRTPAPCPVFGDCGGCQWQQVGLAAQRAAKERIVRRVLEPLGAADRLAPIRGGAGYAYRNRLILPLRGRKGGGLSAGFYRAFTHDIVAVDRCAVQQEALWDAAAGTVALLREAGLPGYDEQEDAGLLRHLLVRVAAGTGETGVVIVTTGGEAPGLADLARALMTRQPAVTGVARNVNPGRTNVILGARTEMLAGVPAVTERIGGLDFRAPLDSFFQANPEVTGLLVEALRGWCAGETGGILDLFCGVGVLGLGAAPAPAWIIGVEEGEEAVAAARENAAALLPDVRTRFEAGTVEAVLPRLVRELEALGTVIMDPPRKGLSPEALRAVAALPAPRLVYVSCDPATFARDARGLLAAGWRLAEVVPFDMFPQTYHIELAARFER
ncbi:MAG: 23S rRNA (uracil(1939)-C(5))-methyltransferase RlmD [bacterium]